MGKCKMIQKKRIKIMIDIVMSVALLFLMAYQVTGDKYHEWIGAGMLLLFVIHNGLNFSWYRTLFKGKYSLLRVVRTIVNLLVLLAIILTGYSGIVLSRHVFAFLPINSGMALARKLHLAGSYWSFVMMSIHLGMHWSMVTGRIKAGKNILRIIAGGIAIYGAVLFGRAGIYDNMFLQNEFAMLDYETSGVVVVLQNLAMMSAWIFTGHYLTRTVMKLSGKEKKDQHTEHKRFGVKCQRISCILAVIVVVACSVLSMPKTQESNTWQNSPTAKQNDVDTQTNQK